MKKSRLLLFALSPLLLLSCGNGEDPLVPLRFGTLIGTQADDPIDHTSQIAWIKKSGLASLVNNEENFLLLLHGSADTCTCYTEWHETILSRYAKQHKALIYGIRLDELESDPEYYGLERVVGADTLAVFANGKLKYQHTTAKSDDPFVTDYGSFSSWMEKRVKDPVIFTVNEEILDGFYEGNEAFCIYFGRDTCNDCTYLNRHDLRTYIDSHDIKEPNFYYLNFDNFKVAPEEYVAQDEANRDKEYYQAMKDKYGLSLQEDNPAGIGAGMFPTIFYVNPDGVSYNGDVIEAAGVFYNETITDGKVSGSYFTKERYDAASSSYLGYLKESKVEKKYFEGEVIPDAGSPRGDAKKDLLRPLEAPIINALLDYCVGNKI